MSKQQPLTFLLINLLLSNKAPQIPQYTLRPRSPAPKKLKTNILRFKFEGPFFVKT